MPLSSSPPSVTKEEEHLRKIYQKLYQINQRVNISSKEYLNSFPEPDSLNLTLSDAHLLFGVALLFAEEQIALQLLELGIRLFIKKQSPLESAIHHGYFSIATLILEKMKAHEEPQNKTTTLALNYILLTLYQRATKTALEKGRLDFATECLKRLKDLPLDEEEKKPVLSDIKEAAQASGQVSFIDLLKAVTKEQGTQTTLTGPGFWKKEKMSEDGGKVHALKPAILI